MEMSVNLKEVYVARGSIVFKGMDKICHMSVKCDTLREADRYIREMKQLIGCYNMGIDKEYKYV